MESPIGLTGLVLILTGLVLSVIEFKYMTVRNPWRGEPGADRWSWRAFLTPTHPREWYTSKGYRLHVSGQITLTGGLIINATLYLFG